MAGGGVQAFRVGGIDDLHDAHDAIDSFFESGENLSFALESVCDVFADLGAGVFHLGTVGGEDSCGGKGEKAFEGAKVVAKIAALGWNDRCSDAENIISSEQPRLLLEEKAEVIRGVTGGMKAAEGCALCFDHAAITEFGNRKAVGGIEGGVG